MVVTVAKDSGRDGYGIAKYSLCGVPTAVDLRLNFFDNDSSPAFNRFHITQIFDPTLRSNSIPAIPRCTYA
jgi:hypothetical protein